MLFSNVVFHFYANFWVKILKFFSGKVRQKAGSHHDFVGEGILETCERIFWGFEIAFLAFQRKLSDYVEIAFWDSKEKAWEPFKSKVCPIDNFRKWF